jgi:hypothetical protein
MEVGFTAIQSKHLGAQANLGDYNNLTATGNASQANAYQIVANYNIFTTVDTAADSAKMPLVLSDPHGIYYILNLGVKTLNLFPAVGDSINSLAANAAITIPAESGAILVKQTSTIWQAHYTFGAVVPPNFATLVPYVGATSNVNLGAYGITVADEAYGSGWDGSLEVPTKNAVYDKIQSIGSWDNWTPTLTGFSANPTNSVYRYSLNGKVCTLAIRQGANGTSNATTFTISLPFTAATITNMLWMAPTAAIVNNGATPTTSGMAQIASAGTTMELFIDQNNGAWTAANGKRVKGMQIVYEIA